MKVFYAISTHWDREWYKPFQGFRYDLVKVVDKLIEALEDGAIDVFTFDGQSIVIEDYLQIKPYNKERIIQLIKNNKLKIGPWYVMPDELLVSGESLIKNFIIGKKTAEKFGGTPWKYGYMNDIFGHIAQMPQLLSDMGIRCAYLGRGVDKTAPNDTNFIWESPDGSKCYGYKETYVCFSNDFTSNSCTEEAAVKYLENQTDSTGIVIMHYTNDHLPVDDNTFKFENVKNNLIKRYDVVEGLEHIGEYIDEFENTLKIKKGELITTAKTSAQLRAVTNSISSYYPLKRENDICQDILENKLSPMLAMAKIAGIDFDLEFYDLAYQYLLKNQPHDSICGCSCDVVHEDMKYRYSQIHSIYDAMRYEYVSKTSVEYNRSKEFCIEVQNFEPFDFDGVFITDIRFNKDWGCKVSDNSRYQYINGFDILDDNGNKVPYQIIDIENNYVDTYKPYAPSTNRYTVAIKSKLHSFGGTVFKIVPGNKPCFTNYYSDGDLVAENEYLFVEIANNGSVKLTDKHTGMVYENLNVFIDDGEMGNGWFSDRPMSNDILVSSKGGSAQIEIINNGPLLRTFRITKRLNIPQSAHYSNYTRSAERTEIKIVTEVSLKAGSKNVEFETTVYNNACDHRLRVEFPTGIEGDYYYSSQAFTFIERKRGITEEGAAFYEVEPYEKNTGGIAVVKNSEYGLSFIGKEGFHECAVSKNGVIAVTMLRSFGRTMFNSNTKNEKAQLIGEHKFRYAISTETNFANLCETRKCISNNYDNVFTLLEKKSYSLVDVEGNITTSIIKPSENKKGIVIRIYNPTDKCEETVVKFAFGVQNAKLVNILEEEISALTVKDNSVIISVSPHKIVSVYVEKI